MQWSLETLDIQDRPPYRPAYLDDPPLSVGIVAAAVAVTLTAMAWSLVTTGSPFIKDDG